MNAKKLSLRELEACAAESGKKLLRTFPEMRLAFLHECGKRRINRAFALRDHYPFWKTNDERSKAGKLLLLNRRDEEHIQIMFDDNIGYGSPHIVDARDAETGQPVSFQVSMHALCQSWHRCRLKRGGIVLKHFMCCCSCSFSQGSTCILQCKLPVRATLPAKARSRHVFCHWCALHIASCPCSSYVLLQAFCNDAAKPSICVLAGGQWQTPPEG